MKIAVDTPSPSPLLVDPRSSVDARGSRPPFAWPPEVTQARLRDGTLLTIRAIRHNDLELERRFVAGLSPNTRYLSLLSGRELSPAEIEGWTDVHPARDVALVGLVADGAREQQVGLVRGAADDEMPGHWDFAVVVADAWQGLGVGAALLEQLVHYAEDAGIAALSSVTLSGNHRMLALARSLGFTTRREPGDATVTRVEKRL